MRRFRILRLATHPVRTLNIFAASKGTLNNAVLGNSSVKSYPITIAGVLVMGAIWLGIYTTDSPAHSGRTNSSGCHTNRKTGDYHCHNGGSESGGSSLPVAPVPSQVSSPTINAITVVSVGDGDTFRANRRGQNITVRLACVDAPESAQKPYGSNAANQLKQLLPVGQEIALRTVERDRYGRTVAEVYASGQSVNLQMVARGQAAVYRQYLNGCPASKQQLLQAEATAKRQGQGMWNRSNPIKVMPWDFRKQ